MTYQPRYHPQKYDMLRGVASIAVLLAHVVQTNLQRLLGSNNTVVLIADNVARHAVLVFFLLSGYLITQSIVANVKRNGRLDCSEYLAARIARIYPPLIGAILVVLVVWAAIHAFDLPGRSRYGLPGDAYVARDAYTVGGGDVFRALLMENGMLEANGPLWSLYMEFHLYVIAMFIVMAQGGGKRLLWGGLGLLLLIFWIRADASFAFFSSVWGVGAATMVAKRRLVESGAVNLVKLLTYPLAAALVVTVLVAPGALAVENPNAWIAYSVQLVCCLLYADLMFLKDRLAANPPNILVQTGHFSYSLYVMHFPLLMFILSMTQNWVGKSIARSLMVATVAIVIVLMVAKWFARFFEDQRRFKPHIKTVLDAIFPVVKTPAAAD
jgi:peptidoglycan/LPS O-acetylase OafA/YrhL